VVIVRLRSTTTLRCAVCHDDARGAVACAACAVLIHDECARLCGGCPTLGCASARGRKVPTGPLLPVPWWYEPLSVAAGFLVVVVLVVGAVTKSKDALGQGMRETEAIKTKITSQIQ
jgi:hypothetical protein